MSRIALITTEDHGLIEAIDEFNLLLESAHEGVSFTEFLSDVTSSPERLFRIELISTSTDKIVFGFYPGNALLGFLAAFRIRKS